ncbi:penicillin acylase family protein [Leifsonia shinshuensis]|uniref:Penicillin acylase family protein n=1 Tax=Leifsonia shinshuensis TaxID=150026 RepID=A0A7G6Y5R1_9MICO|nr:penicillin acylase family protein [Leifsonia shinshuensis]QNE33826.1 penicillin acylase family protein [Leifsonia shinshuensis]
MGDDTPRLRLHHRVLRTLGVTLAVLLVLALLAGGLAVWTVTRSFPQTSGSLTLSSLTAPVTVLRDSAGVPQITARTADDLFRAQGYVHAQDRFWEMDFRRHVTSGRLSELFGASQIPTDTFIRTLGWRQVAEQEVKQLDKTSLRYYQDYADGVNAYLAAHSGAELSLEYAVLGIQNPGYHPAKWTPADSVAWLKAMAWDLRSNLEDEIDRALLSTKLTPQQVAELHPAYDYSARPTITSLGGGSPTTVTPDAAPAGSKASASASADDADATAALADVPTAQYQNRLEQVAASLDALPTLMGPAGDDIGSNSWVVSGAHTATGKPLLANDPHLGVVMPSVWYQIGLHCAVVDAACPFDVAGFSFSGLPGVIIGHNARIAWGFTNLGPDVADLYVEKVTGDTYEYDGAQVPLTIRHETIKVAGGPDVRITVRSTRHGPIITDLSDGYEAIAKDQAGKFGVPAQQFQLSLQWTALTPGPTANAIFAFDTAHDWTSFRAAAASFQVPSQNLLYADVDGNIGYQAPGLIPIRAKGDGTMPEPGWTSEYGWVGTIPYDQLPSILNPPSGYIVTANNAAVGADFPAMITRDWDAGYRANQIQLRLTKLLDAGHKVTSKDMSAIQADTYDASAATLAPLIVAVGEKADQTTGAAKGAALLRGWNYHDDGDSAAAAYYAVFWKDLLADAFGRKIPADAQPAGGDRWFQVVQNLVKQPDSAWWADSRLGTLDRDDMIEYAANQAWKETQGMLGGDPKGWRWDRLHTLELTNASFGSSGVAPIEWLFNRGPYPLGGGSSVVDATGWDASVGYQVDRAPSMRMVVDLGDFDRSTWINLTGASGHAFDSHYADQARLWAVGQTRPWPFTAKAVRAAADQTLTLKP